MTNKIYPCLWFDGNAKQAISHYSSIFKNFKILSENQTVIIFELNDSKFMALNGGPQYKFTPATSFVIECDTQEEIDFYWKKLGENGNYNRCGWLDDQFGLSWQIIPSILPKLMSNPEKAPKVAEAFMKMTKFEIEPLINI